MIRLFVALPLAEDRRAHLAGLGMGMRGVRWVPAENLHITLRFIGEVDDDLARDIDAALAEVTAPAFSLGVSGLGLFGTGSRLRVLWAGVERAPGLLLLKGRVDAALRRLGLEGEGRAYTPHVTLARLDRPDDHRLRAFVEGNALAVAERLAVDSFALFSSDLTRGGPVYTEEARYPLTPARDEDGA